MSEIERSETNLPYGTIISPSRQHGRPEFHTVSPSYIDGEIISPTAEEKIDSNEYSFLLQSCLSEGAYGAVYKAVKCIVVQRDNSGYNMVTERDIIKTDEVIAVKMLTSSDESEDISSINELDILARLRHPNLLYMHQISIVDLSVPIQMKHGKIPRTAIAISMPYATYGDLTSFIKDYKLTFNQNVYILWQILQGIKYLHRERILHMDIKMENMLVFSINPLHVCLADFGMAVYSDNEGLRRYKRESVTITYRPPELFEHSNIYTRKIDVWSIGLAFLYMLLEKLHIYPSIDSPNAVYKHLKATFKDKVRTEKLHILLAATNLSSPEINLAVNFLNRALSYSAVNRPEVKELLMDPIFNTLSLPTKPVRGSNIYRMIWKCPAEEIKVNVYLAINFMIRLAESFNPLAETYFIAIDIFNRALASIYKLHEYFLQNPATWREGCHLGEVLSLGGLVCIWIALKANEDEPPNINEICAAASGHFVKINIIQMERQLIVSLDGGIYQRNPFNDSSNWQELVEAFDRTTDIFQYQHYSIKNQAPLTYYDASLSGYRFDEVQSKPHLARFSDIYPKSEYYQRSCKLDIKSLAVYYYKQHKAKFLAGRKMYLNSQPLLYTVRS